ncbi:MAG TPA: DUF1015 domain-containing protein [Candidatus Omnitrophota bacterium]|nr:DUF1015 domain-containing protein [Candidatus Omnitrophota bacterium]HPT39383.1 DUF1015 domain-containing protein [Candidatus Omnitrophota bacterium]
MSKTKAFKAVVYNPEKIRDFKQVICPPYDVISSQAQDILHERSLYNFIHILLAKDSSADDKYRRAAMIFRDWLKEDVLIQDEQPAVYFYSQQYVIRGEKKTRLGFISLLRLGDEKSSAVFGHENTHNAAKLDRFKLVKQVKANLSPIFIIFLDKKRIIQRIFQKQIPALKPFIEVVDDEKTVHKLWRLTDPDLLKTIESSMNNENMFIADGHHRYEVSCAYRDLMREKLGSQFTGDEDFNFCLAYFTNTDYRGLSILPIHRLLKLDTRLNLDDFIVKAKEYFDVDQLKDRARFFFLMEKAGCTEHLLGLYKDKKYFLLRLKNVKMLDKLIADKPKEYRILDVAILNYLVLKSILNLDLNNLSTIKYSPDPYELMDEVDSDPLNVAFFLNPVKIQQIINIAVSGNKMPPKSTYFYPKVLSGLVVNKFEKE